MRVAALLLVLALPACGGESAGTATPTSEARPRVDSGLCDDLREVVRVREGADQLTGADQVQAAEAAVRAASRRVLVQVGSTQAVPEDVVSALRELEGGAAPDDAVDATVGAYVDRECGGR